MGMKSAALSTYEVKININNIIESIKEFGLINCTPNINSTTGAVPSRKYGAQKTHFIEIINFLWFL